jgi:hypothetical protein
MKTLNQTAFSMLDLVAVREGGTVGDALQIATQTAQHADAIGMTRYWVAEHHNMRGIASSATAVLVCHLLRPLPMKRPGIWPAARTKGFATPARDDAGR